MQLLTETELRQGYHNECYINRDYDLKIKRPNGVYFECYTDGFTSKQLSNIISKWFCTKK